MSDVQRRFVQGDVAAFETLFKDHQRDVFGWIVRLVGDRSPRLMIEVLYYL